MRMKQLASSMLLLALMFIAMQPASPMGRYIEQVKSKGPGSLPVMAATSGAARDRLRQEIAVEAKKVRIDPVNARVDKIWKAIPGYNGLEVDIDKTLALALERPGERPFPFVYREIEPEVTLSDLPANPIYRGNPHKPMVSFMINVAWGNEYIPEILRVLKEENVRSTFFLDGKWLANNEATARMLLDEGHELSNHAYSHKNMSKLSDAAASEEIRKTEALLAELGIRNTLFAPPSGDFDSDTVRIAAAQGLQTILWTIDTVDWRKPTPESVVRKITSQLEPGALILMHPTESSSKALPAMIRFAKKQGYSIGTVSDLISEKRVNPVEQMLEF